MSDVIAVTVFKMEGRKNYYAQWVDPVTGKKKTRSTGTNLKREAERYAGKLQKEWNDGSYFHTQNLSWEEFRERYEQEVVPSNAASTGRKIQCVCNAVERIINPGKLLALNEGQISLLAAELRREGKTVSTIKSILSHLKSMLNWAHRQRLIPQAPRVEMPKRTGSMKGRPITAEEFERMLQAIPKVLFPTSTSKFAHRHPEEQEQERILSS